MNERLEEKIALAKLNTLKFAFGEDIVYHDVFTVVCPICGKVRKTVFYPQHWEDKLCHLHHMENIAKKKAALKAKNPEAREST